MQLPCHDTRPCAVCAPVAASLGAPAPFGKARPAPGGIGAGSERDYRMLRGYRAWIRPSATPRCGRTRMHTFNTPSTAGRAPPRTVSLTDLDRTVAAFTHPRRHT